MGAKRSGGHKTATKNANVAMAARMKAEGVTRRTCRCPICHHLIGLSGLFSHLGGCKGR